MSFWQALGMSLGGRGSFVVTYRRRGERLTTLGTHCHNIRISDSSENDSLVETPDAISLLGTVASGTWEFVRENGSFVSGCHVAYGFTPKFPQHPAVDSQLLTTNCARITDYSRLAIRLIVGTSLP